jgi:ribosomal protein S18 acetylase RimI-like enzyme
VSVAADARGRSLGSALVEHSLRWFGERGMKDVSVVTQGRNAAAQRLYQRCGFITDSVQIWYHRWFRKQP